jgi:hypothetical protein
VCESGVGVGGVCGGCVCVCGVCVCVCPNCSSHNSLPVNSDTFTRLRWSVTSCLEQRPVIIPLPTLRIMVALPKYPADFLRQFINSKVIRSLKL